MNIKRYKHCGWQPLYNEKVDPDCSEKHKDNIMQNIKEEINLELFISKHILVSMNNTGQGRYKFCGKLIGKDGIGILLEEKYSVKFIPFQSILYIELLTSEKTMTMEEYLDAKDKSS